MNRSTVILIPISTENENECIRLKPKEDQMSLVASNADSLIHAKKEITSRPFRPDTSHHLPASRPSLSGLKVVGRREYNNVIRNLCSAEDKMGGLTWRYIIKII